MGSRMLLALRRAGVAALLVVIGGFWASGVGPVATATSPDPTVQIVPSAVTLAPVDAVQVAVLLDNPTSAQVTVGNVRVITPPRVTASSVSGVPATLAPWSSSLATFEVRAEPGFGENQLSIFVEFGQGTSARQVVASLSVKPAAGAVTPEVSFVVFPSKLNDGDGRRATVRLTNPTGVTFANLRLLAVDSDDAYLAMPQPLTAAACTAGTGERLLTCVGDLTAGASVLVDLEVRAHTSVRTGTQQVGVVLRGTPVTTSGAAPNREVAAVATHDVELAVFGVDAISPFGVGTLFLLPGLLAIAVFLTATRFLYPRRTSGLPDKVDPKDLSQMPAIVVVGVIVYVLVWFLWREDLTRRVSTAAVERVFALGILIGVGALALMALLYRHFVGLRRFSMDAQPEDLLLTLKHRHAGLSFPSYTADADAIYLHLGQMDGREYFAPQIEFKLIQPTPDEERRFRNALTSNDIAAILILHKAGKVTLDWRTGAGAVVHDPTAMPVLSEKKDLLREK